MQKALIIIGLLILVIGISWPVLSKLPLGHLPGDIVIKKDDGVIFIPITTMILFSVIFSIGCSLLISWFSR